MTANQLQQLLTPEGQRLLQRASELHLTPATTLQCISALRKQSLADLAAIAVEQGLLREKAKKKFPQAELMYFKRELLEMATGAAVANYRARRMQGYATVIDGCCGLGGDAIALASHGCTVRAWDTDPLAVELCRANAAALGLAHRISTEIADVTATPWPTGVAVFLDPARRGVGGRQLRVVQYQPNPLELQSRSPPDTPLAIKLAPGLHVEDVADVPGELEFIGVEGELKEAVLWCGPLATARRRATLIEDKCTHTLTGSANDEPPELGAVRTYLLDPASAAVRAGLVPQLAASWNAVQIDARVQLLTTDVVTRSPWVDCYRVLSRVKADLKALQAQLLQLDIGTVTWVNRGSLLDVSAIQKKLRGTGPRSVHIFLTRELGEQVAIIATPS